MQAYSAGFAKVYNLRWGGFAQQVAPLLKGFYETKPISQVNRSVLDLCCGTGQLAVLFLEAGYTVVGIDSSEHMLAYAKQNAGRFLAAGQAKFIQGDASHFTLEDRMGLVVSTFDALNHLEDEQALKQCFQCVFDVLDAGGVFIFDLNTRVGLRRWNGISVDDSNDDMLIINRGIYDGHGDKAWTRITGFVQGGDGLYWRFDETAFNTAFELERVKETLVGIGWKEVYFALGADLKTPLAEPEKEGRVFVVACK